MSSIRSRTRSPAAFLSTQSTLSTRPPSPTFSDITHASAMNFGAHGPRKIITRANLKTSLQTYEDLISTCTTYRSMLISMSKATAAFADALERCSGLKGPTYEAGSRLQAVSGVHHLIGNLWHVLSETLDKNFEKPLLQNLETYKSTVNERSASYERALREKSKVIRATELRSMNRKERNLQNFREALTVLQRQVDELDKLKAAHYQEIIEHEEAVWDVVQGKVCVAVRSTMDVFDRITAKASDPIIEPMLQSVPDPFDSYGPPQAEDQIFSILAPLSIMSSAPSSAPSPMTVTPEPHTGLVPIASSSSMSKIASWLPSISNTIAFPSQSHAQWMNTASSPSSICPLPSSSPPSHHSSRRGGTKIDSRKNSESKLRSKLPVIEETTRNEVPETPEPEQMSSSSPSPWSQSRVNGDTPPGIDFGWSFAYGESPYQGYSDQSTTPRGPSGLSPASVSPHNISLVYVSDVNLETQETERGHKSTAVSS